MRKLRIAYNYKEMWRCNSFVYGSWSMRTDEFRYIHYADGTEELYDIRTDPHQWNNLANDPQYADAKEALLDRALAYLASHDWLQGTDASAALFDGTAAADILVTPSPDATIRGGDDHSFDRAAQVTKKAKQRLRRRNVYIILHLYTCMAGQDAH